MSGSTTSASVPPPDSGCEGEGAPSGSRSSGSINESEEKPEEQRPGKRKIEVTQIEEKGQIGPSPKKAGQEESESAQRTEVSVVAKQKNRPGKAKVGKGSRASAATVGEGSRASGPSAAAPRPRYPPFPTGGSFKDLQKWYKQCDKVKAIIEKDLDYDIPTMIKPKDPYTTKAVQNSRDKEKVLHAARSIVSVSHIMDDGQRLPRCTGIIIKQWSDGPGHHCAIIVTYSRVVLEGDQKLDPLPKLSVALPDKKTVLDAELIYFNYHYDIALLYIYPDFSVEAPSIKRGPEYGQEVFVLARDKEASLRARRGNIKWLEESNILGRDYYMFLSCDIPEGGNGGMVIDNDGGFRGMAVYWSPHPAVISISTIEKCIDMFMQFKRVAPPVLGISIRTIALLDVQLREDISDFGITSGFLVYNPAAEELGIRCGNVIVSINGQDSLTLPELEDYLLSLGWDYLKDTSTCMNDVKLRVCDIKSGVERDVTLPIGFYDKAEGDEYFGMMGPGNTLGSWLMGQG